MHALQGLILACLILCVIGCKTTESRTVTIPVRKLKYSEPKFEQPSYTPPISESLRDWPNAAAPQQDRIIPWRIDNTNGVIAWTVDYTTDFVNWTEVAPEWVGFDTRVKQHGEQRSYRLRGITE